MPEKHIPDFINMIPFIGMVTGGKEPPPLLTKLFEAAILGGVVMYGTVSLNGKDIEWIKREINEIQDKQNWMQDYLLNKAHEHER